MFEDLSNIKPLYVIIGFSLLLVIILILIVLYFKKKCPTCPQVCPGNGSCDNSSCKCPSCEECKYTTKCPKDNSCPAESCVKPYIENRLGNNGTVSCDDYCTGNYNNYTPTKYGAAWAFNTVTQQFIPTTVSTGTIRNGQATADPLTCGCLVEKLNK